MIENIYDKLCIIIEQQFVVVVKFVVVRFQCYILMCHCGDQDSHHEWEVVGFNSWQLPSSDPM